MQTILARLPFHIYLTLNHDRLLERALRKEGRNPKPVPHPYVKRSDEGLDEIKSASYQEPVIIHLLGTHADQNDIVENNTIKALESEYLELVHELSSDTYQNYLPIELQKSFKNSSLLFLGFNIHDIAFQTLYWVLYPYIKHPWF